MVLLLEPLRYIHLMVVGSLEPLTLLDGDSGIGLTGTNDTP